ncbi:MAG: type IV pilus modification PilV family protein [Gemmatimonadaceae bacterium]
MRNNRAVSRAATRRSGFTIMELIVAIVILSIGILGLAASSGIVMRMIGGGTHQTVAASVAQTRFETLRALSCGRITSGSASNRNVQEVWSVTPVGPVAAPRAMDVRLSITYQILLRSGSNTSRTQAFRSEILCV